jgi:hypothetical protein
VTDDFRDRLGRVEALVRALEAGPDRAAREAARELARTLLDLHAAGLRRMLELAAETGGLIDRLADDPLVSSLLLLHGLHPLPAAQRAARALERAGPQFHALGGNAELIEATDEAVRLRLRGDADAGPAVRAAAAEVLLEVLPDAAVEFEEAWDPRSNGRVHLPLASGAPGQRREPRR